MSTSYQMSTLLLKDLCTNCDLLAKSSLSFGLPYNIKLPINCPNCNKLKNNTIQSYVDKNSFMKLLNNHSNLLSCHEQACHKQACRRKNLTNNLSIYLSDEAIKWHNNRKLTLNEDEKILQTSNINKYKINTIYSFCDNKENVLFKFEVLEQYTDTEESSETRPGYCVVRYVDDEYEMDETQDNWEYDNKGDWYWYDETGWWYGDSFKDKYDGYWALAHPDDDNEMEKAKLKWELEQQARIDKERNYTAKKFEDDKIKDLKELKFWFDDDLSSQYYNQGEILAAILRESQKWSTIKYENIDCSYFIYLSLLHFNLHACLAIKNNLKNIEAFIQSTLGVTVSNPYPLAIHFAVIARYPECWSKDMHKYFEPDSNLDNISPGTIVAWAYNSFIIKKKTDTGHVGMVTSPLSKNNKFYMTHSIPQEKDLEKNKGGICTTIFNKDGLIIDSMRRYKLIGGGFKLKNTNATEYFDKAKYMLTPPKKTKINDNIPIGERGRNLINELKTGLI